jgi:hypothetical protein
MNRQLTHCRFIKLYDTPYKNYIIMFIDLFAHNGPKL